MKRRIEISPADWGWANCQVVETYRQVQGCMIQYPVQSLMTLEETEVLRAALRLLGELRERVGDKVRESET